MKMTKQLICCQSPSTERPTFCILQSGSVCAVREIFRIAFNLIGTNFHNQGDFFIRTWKDWFINREHSAESALAALPSNHDQVVL